MSNPLSKLIYLLCRLHSMVDVQTLFLGEIQRQATFGLIAYEEIKNSLQSMKPGDSHELDRFWYSVQSFLVAIANISKILWPSAPCNSTLSKEAETRGKSLRNYLAVDDTSPLRSRKFRNYFEHYDFRIEQWAAKSKDRMIIDSNIAPIDYFAGITPTPTPTPISYRRNFDPIKFVLYFEDKEYKIQEVFDAINDLLQKIRKSTS